MEVTINISPELEAWLQAEAAKKGIDTQGYILDTLREQLHKASQTPYLAHDEADLLQAINRGTFAATYEEVSPGRYRKTGEVWAEVAETDGNVTTQEGVTHYRAGDYLVCNVHDDTDRYAISRERFQKLYEPV